MIPRDWHNIERQSPSVKITKRQRESSLKRVGRPGGSEVWEGVWLCPSPEKVFEFSTKMMHGLMHFYCEKLLVTRNRDRES